MSVPQEAIDAALKSLHDTGCPCGGEYHPPPVVSDLARLRIALEAAAPLIEAAERQRIYDQLGHGHFVIFTEDGWTVEHSVECRLSGHMHECELHTAVGRVIGCGAPVAGRWRIDGIDSEGLPSLTRAEPGVLSDG